jgi:hypothetical protein
MTVIYDCKDSVCLVCIVPCNHKVSDQQSRPQVRLQIVALLTDNPRLVIYDRHNLIAQATGLLFIKSSCDNNHKDRNRNAGKGEGSVQLTSSLR